MKKERTIIIRDSKLRKIRNNLRMILILESVARRKVISARRRKIRFDKNGSLRSLTTKEKEKICRLSLEGRKYLFSMRESICFCELCHSTDRDMSYLPRFKQWYCVNCCKEIENEILS